MALTTALPLPGDPPTRSAASPRVTRSDALRPVASFQQACEAVLQHLNHTLPLENWVVSRVVGDDWVVLSADGANRALDIGDTYRWSDTVCARMVTGRGPRSTPRIIDVASYALAPVVRDLPVGAYLGAELVDAAGSLFGTLCGLHPIALDGVDLVPIEDLVVLQARLLSSVLGAARSRFDAGRQDERLSRSVQADPTTGLLDRAGWDALLTDEERRLAILGLPAGVIVIELVGLRDVTVRSDLSYGDRTLRETGDILRAATRRSDSVARTGETDFAVLLPDCGPLHLEQVASRIRDGLHRRSIRAWVGAAPRDPSKDLAAAVDRAATARYQDKRR